MFRSFKEGNLNTKPTMKRALDRGKKFLQLLGGTQWGCQGGKGKEDHRAFRFPAVGFMDSTLDFTFSLWPQIETPIKSWGPFPRITREKSPFRKGRENIPLIDLGCWNKRKKSSEKKTGRKSR